MGKDRIEEFYHPDDDEWAAIQEGLAQAERGQFVPDEEIARLRADIEIGLRQLDAGEGEELDIEDVIRQVRKEHE
jgi:hypothetical protein